MDPQFYAGMRERSWSDAAKYYLVIAFIVIFAYAAPVWGLLLTVKPELVDTIVAVYPENLEVTLADGAMSINQPLPFSIKNTWTKELPENLVVFDTGNDEYTPRSLDEAKAVVLFKRTFAVVQGDSSGAREQRVFDYGTSTGTSTLHKSDITGVAEKIKPYVRPVALIGGAFLFTLIVVLGGVVMLVYHLIYTLLVALLVFVYFKLSKRDETYATSYTTALFASLPVAIIAGFIGPFGGLPSFIYTALVLLIVIVNTSRSTRTTP